MTTASGDPGTGSSPPPAGEGPATGGGSGGPMRRPSPFVAPPDPSLGNSPELKKIVWFGAALLMLGLVALLYRPQGSGSSSLTEGPAPVESPEEHAKRVATAFGGALPKMVDGVDFGQTQAYLQVVEEVSKSDSASFHERTRKFLDWGVAVSTPGALRGDYVRVRGVVAREIQTVKLFQPAGKVEDVYRFIIVDPDGTRGVVVDLVERPTKSPEVMRHAVDLEGVFIRTLKFENAKGQMTEAPYVIARNLTIDVDRSDQGRISAIGLGILAIGLLVVFRVFMRKKPTRVDHRTAATMHRPGASLKELHELHEWKSRIAQARAEGAAKRALGTPPTSSEPPKS